MENNRFVHGVLVRMGLLHRLQTKERRRNKNKLVERKNEMALYRGKK